jgi:hypothetical protein
MTALTMKSASMFNIIFILPQIPKNLVSRIPWGKFSKLEGLQAKVKFRNFFEMKKFTT